MAGHSETVTGSRMCGAVRYEAKGKLLGVGGFCDQCGTPLTCETPVSRSFGGQPLIEFHISTLDDPDRFVLDRHWFHGERISWFEVADDLPRYRGFGMGGEKPYTHGPATEDS